MNNKFLAKTVQLLVLWINEEMKNDQCITLD